jgi:hypothetical protein
MYARGKPYFPTGIQDCVQNRDGDASFEVDGEGRTDGSARRLTADEYFTLYGDAGFNLLRYSQRNCSGPLFDSLDSYRPDEMKLVDRLLASARKHGFHVMFGFFGYHGHWYEGSFLGKLWHVLRLKTGAADEALEDLNTATMTKEKWFIEYAVARWGEYTDFWELLNERRADDRWIQAMAAHVHATDPHRKPVTTSWDRPELADLDYVAPHWYSSEPPAESDIRVREQAARWKSFGKPVLFGEHGNNGMNWDPGSADRLRVRLWTALFHEVGFILWNTGWSKSGMYEGRYTPGEAANIYIGPQERAFVRSLANFQSRLAADLRPVPMRISNPTRVRAYGLASGNQSAAYVRRFAEPSDLASETLELPVVQRHGSAEWIDPATGRLLESVRLKPDERSLSTPRFSADLALLVSYDLEN